LKNRDKKLKPGMIAQVNLYGRNLEDVLTVEENALIRSGKSNTVVLSLGGDNYKPVKVEVGQYAEGYYEVLSGLDEGVSVVTSAQFLIDSESNLKAAVSMFNTGSEEKEDEGDQEQNESGIVREGVIDVESIDSNGDGKLFECPMDWNVLNDDYQRCPVCEMKMKEYTIEEVKENLRKYGYEYK
jgi:Cu(I)/Ag(I) efflux system membrane fusion protein